MKYRWRGHSLDEISKYQTERGSLIFQENVDRERVNELVQHFPEKPNPFLFSELADEWSIEQKTAYAIKLKQRFQEMEWPEIAAIVMLQNEDVIQNGISIIKSHNDYWLFEPCIEEIFELEQQELNDAYEYLANFSESDHAFTLRQQTHSLHENLQVWDPDQLNSDSFDNGLDIYQNCMGIFERGFPNFLALKRILDGETPENEILQRKSASSVRRELSNSSELNSAYFDLMVEKFDVRLRNGISHGDVLYAPSDAEIRIPTENVSYSHEKFNGIVHTNVSTAMFLMGAFESLIAWQRFANMDEEITRSELGI
jgi:hypothetical protein